MKKLFFSALVALFSCEIVNAQAVNPLWLRDVQISPDGQHIAFCYKGDIYKVGVNGGTAVQLTTQDSYESSPVWSADGTQIAFASVRHGNMDVFVMSSEGGAARRLTYNSAEEIPQAFSPDGKDVYFGASIQDPATSVMFPSSRLPELYKVAANGGRTQQVLGTPAEMLSWAPDGKSFFYQDKKGYEDEWRKHHTSSITRDIWFYDATTGNHTNLTNHAGEDRNPVCTSDGRLLFLSERNGGSMNVYSLDLPSNTPPLGAGGLVGGLTHFTTHPVRFLSEAKGLMCFTYDGEIYTQRVGGEPQKVAITLTRDDGPQIADLSFSSGADEATVSSDGKEVALVVRGEVFVTSTEYRTTKQITQTAGAERGVSFAPDGRSLVYSSERDGNWQLYIATIGREDDPNFSNATVINEEVLLPSADVERSWPKYSPDGKKIAFIQDRIKLMVVDLATKQVTEVTDGSMWFDQDGQFEFEWSPDSKWFVLNFIAHKRDPYTDQGIVSVDGGEIHPITESAYMSHSPRWVMDGKAVLFESERYGMRSHASWGSQDDAFLAFLTQDAYDKYRLSEEDYALMKELKEKNKDKKDEKDEKADTAKKSKKGKKDDKAADDDKDKVEPIEIEFEGLADRIVRVTPNSSHMGDAIVDKNGENLYYYAAFEDGYDLWKMNLRKHETELLDKSNTGSASLLMDKDGNIYSLGSDKMVKIDGKSDKRTNISYSAKMRLDLQAEREYMYRHMAKQIEKKIFRTDYNGCDWPMMVETYAKFLPHIANNYDYQELLSEILGELNVSHTGGRYYHQPSNPDVTAQLGLIYATQPGEGYTVADILEGGPFDRADSKLQVGDVITAINGQPLTADTDISQLLNLQTGKKTLVAFKGKAGEKEEVVLPISNSKQNTLLYDRWVKSRREAVDSLSHGRLGYVHIQGMNDASFRSVYSDILGKYNEKEGIVIDTRHNGGGRLHEDIEILFSGEHYFTQVIRGREVCDMPSRRYNHPSIMIQAEGNYSNAHGTPWVYSHKKIGKLVGSPVPGTMSSVNWETMQDESLVFGVPVIGYQLPDGSYLENTQLEPDIYVLNRPETVVQGVDLQLQAAVEELLKEIDQE